MFKNLDTKDVSIRPFQVNKNFTHNNNDSGSGVFAIKAISGSFRNYDSGSDTVVNIVSSSLSSSYFALPTWHTTNNSFYRDFSSRPSLLAGSGIISKQNRELNGTARIISVAKNLYGERIKPGSINLSATIDGITFDIRDDEDGNLYDNAHSASFAAFKSSSFDRSQGVSSVAATRGSGSEVGNVFYDQGLLVITDTGSYSNLGDQGNPYTLKHQATRTIYEYEFRMTANANEFNRTTNISTTKERSGSVRIDSTASGSGLNDFIYQLFPLGDQPTGQGTGSFSAQYTPASQSESFVTSSDFYPYVTQVGLYDDFGQLLVIGKLGKPIKLSTQLDTTFVVRFDV